MRIAERVMRKAKEIVRLFIVLIAAIMAVAAPLAADAAGQLGKRIVLKNGMVLLLAEKHEIPMVTVSMAIKAGNVVEPTEKAGLSSLTAALMTQGTTRRTANQISREIDFVGGSLSVSGGDDYASAGLRVLKKDLKTGLDLLADVLMHPAFDQKEIDRKVKETLASIQQQKDEPEVIAGEAFTKAVFGAHPYGRTNDDVAAYLPKLTRQDVADFYSRWYGPNDVIIAVVGDVTEKEIVSLLDEQFEGWKNAERARTDREKPPVIGSVVVKKIDKKITQANIAMGHVGISRENPDFYAVMIMNYILGGGGFSSRLMDNIRDNRGLAYNVHSSFSAQKEPGPFRVWVQTKNESANQAIEEIFKELKRIRTEPVTDKELADAKAYLTGSFPLRMDTSAKIAAMMTSVEMYNLGLDYPQKYPALIDAVTKDDILRVAKKYLDLEKIVIVVLGDQDQIKLKY
jgi:zinc protease